MRYLPTYLPNSWLISAWPLPTRWSILGDNLFRPYKCIQCTDGIPYNRRLSEAKKNIDFEVAAEDMERSKRIAAME